MVHRHHCFLDDCIICYQQQAVLIALSTPPGVHPHLSEKHSSLRNFHPCLDQKFPELVVFHCCVYGSLEPSLLTHFLKFKTCRGGLCKCSWGLFSASLSWMSWAHKWLFPTVRSSSCSWPSRPAGRNKIKWENLWACVPRNVSLCSGFSLSPFQPFTCCCLFAAITKYHRLCGFNNWYLCSHSSGARSSRSYWQDWFLPKPLLGLCMATFSLCLYMVFPMCVHMSVS